MRVPINRIKWYENLWASMAAFTSIPYGRRYEPTRESMRCSLEFLPCIGWITGAAAFAIIFFGNRLMPHCAAVILALAARLLITGAIHEKGLWHFINGFARGRHDRMRILLIMRESRLGIQGISIIIAYELSLLTALASMPYQTAALMVLAADPYAKMLAAQLAMMMPHASTEEDIKTGIIYRKMTNRAGILLAVQGLLPAGIAIYAMPGEIAWQYVLFLPCVVMYLIYMLIWNRLRGYTISCCSAMCMIIELAVYLTATYMA